MPTSKKPRKRYRPKPVLQDPVGYTIGGFTRLTADEVAQTLTVNHDAMLELTQGRGTVEHWRIVTGVLNMAAVLDEQVYGSTYKQEINDALRAHGRCGVRRWNGGNFGYSGPDLQLVNFALVIHDEQVSKATVGEVERAVLESQRRAINPNEHISVRQMAQQAKETAIV